jgi:hypothetical protein
MWFFRLVTALRHWLGPAPEPPPDPLDHPSLVRMSLAELADLPPPTVCECA